MGPSHSQAGRCISTVYHKPPSQATNLFSRSISSTHKHVYINNINHWQQVGLIAMKIYLPSGLERETRLHRDGVHCIASNSLLITTLPSLAWSREKDSREESYIGSELVERSSYISCKILHCQAPIALVGSRFERMDPSAYGQSRT